MAKKAQHPLVDAFLREKIGMTLSAYLREQRRAGRSWEYIARDLERRTDRAVQISSRTVQRWADELLDGEAA